MGFYSRYNAPSHLGNDSPAPERMQVMNRFFEPDLALVAYPRFRPDPVKARG